MTAGCTSVLLVHGAGGGGWEWNVWRGVMQAHGFDSHAPELQPAAAGFAATTLDEYMAQVRTRLLVLPRPRVLVGASLGGLVAALCAGNADALVLVYPFPGRPWHSQLPPRQWSEAVPWQREARLSGTRAALGDADAASALFAYRRWQDQPGAPLRSAWMGVEVVAPACPVLFVVSKDDDDVPPQISRATAVAWEASFVQTLSTSHAGPLLGAWAAQTAEQAVAWVNQVLLELADSDPVRAPAP